MNRLLLVTLFIALSLSPAWADVFISEFLANNETGLVDQDGDHSDWIEIHNNGASTVNLQGWRLTDDSGDLSRWVLPSVDIAPNGFLIVFASNKDRTNPAQALHTNFKLSSTGGYLALVMPNGNFASEFNPYPAHYPDKPYGYSQTVNTTTFVGTAGALKWRVPTDNSLALNWTTRTFLDTGWTSGTNAAGFETSVAGWQVRTVFANTANVSSAAVAETVLATPSQQASSTTVTHPIIDWTNTGANGHFSPDNPPPALNTAADLDYYIVEGSGIVTISTPGTWTFCISSDDGCTLQIRPVGAGSYSTVITDPGLRGMGDSVGSYNFASAGDYEIRAVIYENGGGSGGEVSARSGAAGSWDANFKRIGDTGAGGLAIRSVPPGGSGSGGYASLLGTNLLASMYNTNPKRSSVFLRYAFNVANPATVNTLTLQMQYDDGFVAYLNGQEIGRRNVAAGTLNFDAVASADRPNASALLAESLDATTLKNQLVAGTNVLAIHGLNWAAADGDLLMRPQLSQFTGTTGALAYFTTPTPGSFNTSAVYNRVAPVFVSVPHGFYTTSQSVQLTCATPGATIYYTYDGSIPSPTNPASASGASPVNLTISSTRVLRAVGVKSGSDNGDVLASTYLFLSDVITQSAGGAPPTFSNPPGAAQATTVWPSGPINNQVLDFGMDPDIVNNPTYSGTILNDLKAIPTISVVTDKNNLFHQSYGIYVNPGQDGDSADPNYPDPISPPQNWERRASIELINPDGTPGFQANCGLRLRGGFSRSTDNPKHALRFFFRDEYGLGKLNYDLHRTTALGAGGAKEFNKFDLRCAQNYSWSFQGDGGNGVFVRDVVARDMQLAMGQPSSRGAFFHLYLNGQYWGLYNVDERPEANFGETYLGGDADDYDVIKIDPDNGYNLEATDGTTTAWAAYWTLADQTLPAAGTESARNAIYQQMKGNNANGTSNPSFPVYLDDVGLIDEMLVVYYGGNLDAPISNFLGNTSGNNVYSLRNRNGASGGWKGVLHDSEHTLLNVNENRTGPWSAGSSAVQGAGQALNKSTQQYIFQQLVANSSDFRILFADRVYKHMANGGVLSPAGALAIFNARTTEIDRAVVAESARWGDAKSGTPFTRNGNWLPATNNIRNNYFPTRTTVVLGQYRTQGWYPSFDPPVWSIRGGTVAPGTTITLSLPPGVPGGSVVYYTLDGSDPRALGGGISPNAIQYSGPIPINVSRFIRTRVKSASDWSAIDEAAFYTTQNFTGLAFTEINYRPLPTSAGGTDEDDYEFIEFKNTSASTIDMGGVNFTTGITYTFPPGTSIAPGQFFLLVRNFAKFAIRYPGVSMAARTYGEYTGKLDNGGETLTLNTFSGTQVMALTYNDTTPWPAAADGNGFTAVPNGITYNSDNGLNWRASANIHGSPRADDPAASFPAIVVNEILANSGAGQKDTIELHNPTGAVANIGDWWLTDDPNIPKKYRIPAGTSIAAGGFITFNEDQFNIGASAFALNSTGDDVYVFSGNASGNLTGYSHGIDFGGVELNRSLGRYVNSVGEEQYTRQVSSTFGTVNSGPLVGPLVISEIMYNPFPGYDEYVEVRNISASSVSLFDPANPANRWRISGINYTFPAGQSITAGGVALVVNIDPATFRTKYGIPGSVAIYGPYIGNLQDGGERLSLEMPDTPVVDGQGITVIPYDVIDSVRYNDKAPWPNVADGSGPSLQRSNNSAYGDDPINWFADGVTPGATNSVNSPPSIAMTAPANSATFTIPSTIAFTASATDSDGSVLKVEYFVDGVKVGESSTAPSYTFNWTATAGIHTVTAKALDNSLGSSTSAPRTIYVTQTVSQGLKAEYFGNNALSGVPAGTRIDGPITFSNSVNSWPSALGFPGVGTDQFSVRWSGQFRAINTGNYLFRTISDQGVRLYVNGALVINNWTPHTTATNTVSVSLTGGQLYDFTLEYFELTEDHTIQLLYVPAGGASVVTIPASVLYPDDVPIVVTQPVALVREHASGVAATFSVQSSGKNLTYQWKKDNVDIPGATSSSYTVNYPLLSDAGTYNVIVANSFGFAISTPVNLTVTFTDTDSDGIQDAWETANGMNPGLAADAVLDTDGDGFNNKAEYLAGTDPRNPQSRPTVTITKATGVGFKLDFAAQPYKTYSIQARESLTSGSWTTLQSYPVSPTLQNISYTDPTTLPTRHYRVVTP